mmetsp:Transcript_12143/g.19042  ORF Transcript_12143/g.19042 Transcript_12143/m.19042 type:complete len:761 (+) Transcript_12143:2-2284(+)
MSSKHDFKEQMEWIDKQIVDAAGEAGKVTRGGAVKNRGEAQLLEFRKRLRTLFMELDVDHSGNVDLREMKMAMHTFGLRMTDELLLKMFEECDTDNSGTIDFDEFENVFTDIFLNTNKPPPGHWSYIVKRNLESKLRPPPPIRPNWKEQGLHAVGSTKPAKEANRHEANWMQVGKMTYNNNLASPHEDRATVSLEITCTNLPSVLSRLKKKNDIPGFPCRPVCVLNIQEPRSGIWFEAAHSDWLGSVIKPFTVTMTNEYFQELKGVELAMYDLESGMGTAKIRVSTWFMPNKQIKHAPAQPTEHGGRRGSAFETHGDEPCGELVVVIEEASQLPRMDTLGLSDPYAKVSIGTQKHQTKTEKCTLNPTWKAEFSFQVDWSSPIMTIDVYDWDAGPSSDDFIGTATVSLSQICDRAKSKEWQSAWYHIRTTDGMFVWGSKVKGQKEVEKTGFFSKWTKKLQRWEVEDARNYTASPEYSLGALQITNPAMRQVLSHCKQIENKRKVQQTQVKSMQKHLEDLFLGWRERDVFLAWAEVVKNEKDIKYLQLGNNPDKYASLGISAVETSGGGENKFKIQLAASQLPKKDYFGLSDPYLVLEVLDDVDFETGAERYKGIHKTAVMEKNLNPVWPAFQGTVEDYLDGDFGKKMRASVYDWNMVGKDELLGRCTTNLHELESLSRAQSSLPLVDQHGSAAGSLVAVDVRHWISTAFVSQTYKFAIEVHSWVPGDAFSVQDSAANQRRAKEVAMQAEVDQQRRRSTLGR